MVWKKLKSYEAKLVTLKGKLEAREKQLSAKGLPKERNGNDPMVRHFIAESRQIQRAIAAYTKAHESPAERAEKSAKRGEGKPSKPGKEAKPGKETKPGKEGKDKK